MLPHTVYCRDKEGPQHTHQEYMCCTGHQRAKGWIKQWEGTELEGGWEAVDITMNADGDGGKKAVWSRADATS